MSVDDEFGIEFDEIGIKLVGTDADPVEVLVAEVLRSATTCYERHRGGENDEKKRETGNCTVYMGRGGYVGIVYYSVHGNHSGYGYWEVSLLIREAHRCTGKIRLSGE